MQHRNREGKSGMLINECRSLRVHRRPFVCVCTGGDKACRRRSCACNAELMEWHTATGSRQQYAAVSLRAWCVADALLE